MKFLYELKNQERVLNESQSKFFNIQKKFFEKLKYTQGNKEYDYHKE